MTARLSIVLASLLVVACDDGVCIRNSDCDRGFRCLASTCTRVAPEDAGPDAGPEADGGAVDDDAGTPDAGD
jgi:hypothetical protein